MSAGVCDVPVPPDFPCLHFGGALKQLNVVIGQKARNLMVFWIPSAHQDTRGNKERFLGLVTTCVVNAVLPLDAQDAGSCILAGFLSHLESPRALLVVPTVLSGRLVGFASPAGNVFFEKISHFQGRRIRRDSRSRVGRIGPYEVLVVLLPPGPIG